MSNNWGTVCPYLIIGKDSVSVVVTVLDESEVNRVFSVYTHLDRISHDKSDQSNAKCTII